jgi:tellurite resistance protein TehA-like permease
MLPKKTRELFHTDVEQTAYLSCSGIALATLVELTALIPGSTWHRWEYVSFSFWWIAMAYSIIGSAAVYDILIRHEQVHLHNLTPQLLYPLTAVLSTCSAGSAAIHYTPLSRGLSMPILVVCYMMLGMGR